MTFHSRNLLVLSCLCAACGSPNRRGGDSRGEAPPLQMPIHHDLEVRVEPAQSTIEIVDHLQIATQGAPLEFTLHANLRAESLDPAWTVEPIAPASPPIADGTSAPVTHYRLRRGAGATTDVVGLRIRGKIDHSLHAEKQEYARSFSSTPGIISAEGVVLSGSSVWLPTFAGRLLTFKMAVDLPADWAAVSQGRRTKHTSPAGRVHETWECPHPMEEVYLIANRFTEYRRDGDKVSTSVYLHTPDRNLAVKYLEVTEQYIAMYGQLIGPYPYAKFALVENFWETGYGMPSFTLLGPSVIRLPFILHSSYPHEILHNWWGNSVYVDWQSGNWCEGLTAYLADHLIKEGQERGRDYRRDTLARYRNYVRSGKDFPLREFRSRHSSATEAIGYGKAAMLFHMLRRSLGDERFTTGLRQLYARHKFRQTSYDDLSAVFSQVAGRDLSGFFAQWVDRTGAPALSLLEVDSRADQTTITVAQTQPDLYQLAVPVAFSIAGRDRAHLETIELNEARQSFTFTLPGKVTRVDLDPYFDLFRRLDRSEIPPTLAEIFGAEHVTIVLPGAADELAGEWRKLAESWQRGGADITIVDAKDVDALPGDRALWLLGSGNRVGASLAHLFSGEEVVIAGTRLPRRDTSAVVTGRHPGNPELAWGWITSPSAAAVAGLTRKLPHYGKYSYLAFTGDEPRNVAKGTWPVDDSPMTRLLAAGSARAPLPQRQPLARIAPPFDAKRMRADLDFIAGDSSGGRGLGSPELDRVGDRIAASFAAAGLEPGGDDGSYFQSWSEAGGPAHKSVRLRNVIGVLPGSKPAFAKQSVVIGAHYDHLGRGWPDVNAGDAGKIHNGADDNGSGVVVLLELARSLSNYHPDRSIIFVAFSGEEWQLRGSRHYVARSSKWPAAQAIAMVNIDTVGRLGKAKLTVLGTGSAREWPHIVMGVGYTTGVEGAAVADDPGGSDQKSFQEAGIPAIQLFTGGHADYHRPSDDVAKIDIPGLVSVCAFAREVLVYLAGRPDALTSTLAGAPSPASAGRSRRVSLGTMPAFDFSGPGAKVALVTDGSPAARAGIVAGDIIIAIDGEAVANLRAYSAILERHKPGDEISIELLRDGATQLVKAVLAQR